MNSISATPANVTIVIPKRRALLLAGALIAALAGLPAQVEPQPFHFAILGDRTGETVAGVYPAAWAAAAAEHPAFVVTVGDTIQGMSDANAEAEWQEAV